MMLNTISSVVVSITISSVVVSSTNCVVYLFWFSLCSFLVYSNKLPVSLDCLFLIAPSVFFGVYLRFYCKQSRKRVKQRCRIKEKKEKKRKKENKLAAFCE